MLHPGALCCPEQGLSSPAYALLVANSLLTGHGKLRPDGTKTSNTQKHKKMDGTLEIQGFTEICKASQHRVIGPFGIAPKRQAVGSNPAGRAT